MNKGGTSSMAKVYNEEFKKQLVKEYIQGKSYASLEKEYGVAKSTLSAGFLESSTFLLMLTIII